jgi:hypothetical protein
MDETRLRYRDPIFVDLEASTSTTSEVKVNEEVDDLYYTHVDYAKMLQDHRTITDNSIMIVVNMIMPHFVTLEDKTIDCVDAFADKLASEQPQYGPPYNFVQQKNFLTYINTPVGNHAHPVTPYHTLQGPSMEMRGPASKQLSQLRLDPQDAIVSC